MESGMVLLFRKPAGVRDRNEAVRELADWTRAILKADDEVAVSVLDLDCCADGCCDPETVILVMPGDRPAAAVRISKSLESVSYTDIEAALSCGSNSGNSPRPGRSDERSPGSSSPGRDRENQEKSTCRIAK
jgi:hypothetical protein